MFGTTEVSEVKAENPKMFHFGHGSMAIVSGKGHPVIVSWCFKHRMRWFQTLPGPSKMAAICFASSALSSFVRA